ncbi:hypothetical protein [Nannocystis pusilla]|uniref:hypothetical protein n=1 Tax=Nannocystis pusilla TaxID=889268 RepID=UPI003DA2CD03
MLRATIFWEIDGTGAQLGHGGHHGRDRVAPAEAAAAHLVEQRQADRPRVHRTVDIEDRHACHGFVVRHALIIAERGRMLQTPDARATG